MSLKVIITCMCLINSGTSVRSVTDGDQAFWYYAMVRLRTIDLKSHPIAQFTKNRIIHKKCTKFIKQNINQQFPEELLYKYAICKMIYL